MNIYQLYDYQRDNAQRALDVIRKHGLVYLAYEVRTGKTVTALETCRLMDARKVLFITKKKAITSIVGDHDKFSFPFELTVTNYESAHKIEDMKDVDVVVLDEAHCMGAYPKPSQRTKTIKQLVKGKPIIYLSGTPTPETWSQLFHQLWVSSYTPFNHTSFYKWAKDYVNVTKKQVSHGYPVNDYTDARIEEIQSMTSHLMLNYSQKDAGFAGTITEHIETVDMGEKIPQMVDQLNKDKVLIGRSGTILGDSASKLLQKVHQMWSGTVKLEGGKSIILSDAKAQYIVWTWPTDKVAIFYKFKAEWDMIKKVMGDAVTDDLDEFNHTGKSIALQIVSGREGINLSKADRLVFLNIDHSATSYWQGRDRLTTRAGGSVDVHWLFAKGGIERSIYKTVMGKKSFTTKHYDSYVREQLSA